MADIDWNESIAGSTAIFYLRRAFNKDPMMQLFDKDALFRLAVYIIDHLKGYDNPSIYKAYHLVAYEIMPNSPYGAFGQPLARKVASLVQMSLYPDTWEREYTGNV